jgi:alkanesulfonate monooxygenase SsuD/methylene tetrahydromethanopterin reductase-like flavin-dependent oxidoreductase (luciferase family)
VPDYGHDLFFGTFLTPRAADPEVVVALAQLTERAGLDLVSVQDHPYQPAFLDAWTLLSYLAAATERVRLAPNVANLPLRPPAVLARAAASLDLLSGGRVELGLGAGAFWEAIAANGGPRREPGAAVEALTEAIEVIRTIWAAERSVKVAGEHYHVVGAKAGPAPAHDIGVWLGAYKPRMLRLTGRVADGWLPSLGYAPPAQLPAMHATIDSAAEAAGRDPAEIRRLYNISGSFGRGSGFLAGPPEQWAQQLAELALSQGISAFILGSDDPADIQRFGTEVAPRVRELVAAGRADAEVVAGRTGSEVTAGRADSEVAADRAGSEGGTGRAGSEGGTGRAGSEGGAVAVGGGVPAALGVTPTPDNGARRTGTALWDESTRPSGPGAAEGRAYTAHEQAAGQHLVDVHDALRQELAQLDDLVVQVQAGALGVGEARSQLQEMTLRQNNWTLGTYCESYCRVVTTHHTLEDVGVFPHLRRTEPGLSAVLDRLVEEHHAIHGAIEAVDRALVALVGGGALADLRHAIDVLADALLSHLSYEERELVEPLARHGFQ